mgnify:CR=1 FL=1
MQIDLDPALAARLAAAARALGRDPAACAREAIRVFVEDCEEAAGHRARLGASDGWMPPLIDPED